MNEVTLTDFRCFHEEQTTRLAPLTLLLGENSTGKTSFMAMIRALWTVAFQQRSPDFKEAPYDLGSFDEVVCHLGGRSRKPETFMAGFGITPRAADSRPFRFEVTFGKRGDGMPAPERMRLSDDDSRIEAGVENRNWHVSFRTVGAEWEAAETVQFADSHNESMSPIWQSARPCSAAPSDEDGSLVAGLLTAYQQEISRYDAGALFASAPVRSKPLRTYDLWHSTRDSEGDHTPTYVAEMYSRDDGRWSALRAALEEVGKDAGLFDEFTIERLSKREGSPFQVKVRKFGSRSKGPWRNLIDAGYGVSQTLPVLTELLRSDASALFLLQHPEVHLHPSSPST